MARSTDPPVREPDPTIDAHAYSTAPFPHIVVIGDIYADPAVAHRADLAGFTADLTAACGARRLPTSGPEHIIPTHHARWIARPCRRCWRDAPLPGRLADGRHGLDLDWQLPRRSHP